MMMKSVFWWRKPEYPEETTDLRQVTDETFHSEWVGEWVSEWVSGWVVWVSEDCVNGGIYTLSAYKAIFRART